MQGREFIGAITATAAGGALSVGADDPKDTPNTRVERPKETRRGDMLYRQWDDRTDGHKYESPRVEIA